MVILFTSIYKEINPVRYEEVLKTLNLNLESKAINRICLFLERTTCPVENEKIIKKHIGGRPTYKDFLDWCKIVSGGEDDIVVIANSDIFLDKNILALCQSLRPNQCAALSRWDIAPSGTPVLFDRNDSQDVWVFRGPLKKILGEFPVGVPRCDNRFLHELQSAGYEVINPAFSIRAYHLHSGIRPEYAGENQANFVDPPYAYVWPHNLWSLPRTYFYNFRHPDARLSWRFDRRKFAGSLPVRAAMKIGRMLTGKSRGRS